MTKSEETPAATRDALLRTLLHPLPQDKAGPGQVLPAAAALAKAVLEDALGARTMRRVTLSGRPFLACVEVPDPTWFEPLRTALKRMAQVSTYDAGTRRSASFETSAGAVVEALAEGKVVCCVSQDVSVAVPREVLAAADVRATLDPPTAEQVARAIRSLRSDETPFAMPDDLVGGLGLLEVAACLRPGERGRTMVRRIRRAAVAKGGWVVDTSAPRIEDLHGYGDVAGWGLRLVEDVARYRAGGLAWRDVSRPAVLCGPPGTGKTLFARAVARSLGAPLAATSVGAWFQSGNGDLGATVRTATAVFGEARQAARQHGAAVLFVDELDGLPNRTALDADTGSWWRPVVNHILTLIDGAASSTDGVVLLAATNDLAALDAALLRPGRFGTVLRLDPPGLEDLARIVLHHLGSGAGIPLGDVVEILRPLTGATQARAAAWAAEASRRARDAGRSVTRDDLVAVVRPPDRRTALERRRTAVHEAGHAVAAWHLARARFLSVSIVETATTHGSVLLNARDDALLIRDEIETEVVLALSGRAADSVVGDGPHAGAGGAGCADALSDLQVATKLLTDVHARFGLGPTLRHREVPGPDRLRVPDAEVAQLVEADLRRLMARAVEATTARAGEVRAVAEALLERGVMTSAEVGQVIGAT